MEYAPWLKVLVPFTTMEIPMSDLKNATPFSSSRIAWATGALCVACCAAPFIGIAIGAATLAAFALYSEGVVIAIATLGAILLAYKFIPRKKAPSCDLDCGCHPTSDKEEKIPKNPVACNLTNINSRAQQKNVYHSLLSRVQEIQDLKTGFRFRFEHNQANIAELKQFIRAEQECCHFLVFDIEIEPDKGSVWLEITGEQAKSFLKSELGLYLRSEPKKE